MNLPMRDADAAPGSGWMMFQYDTAVDLSSMSTGACTISLYTYDPILPGALATFDAALPYAWTIITATGGISGFASNQFVVNTTHFLSPITGSFAVACNTAITLQYTPVPEPIAWILAALGAMALRRVPLLSFRLLGVPPAAHARQLKSRRAMQSL